MFGLWNRIQGANLPEGWKELETSQDLEEAVELSNEQPVLLFKHSVRCGISAQALDGITTSFDLPSDTVQVYYLDLINNRELSNEIAARFKVIHQSPQMILLDKGEAVMDTSHHMISLDLLKEWISVSN